MRTRRLLATAITLALGCAAPAFAQDTCDAHFTRSQTMTNALTDAYVAMQAKDVARMATLLPTMEALLNTVPATEIKPEVCNGNRINVYSRHDYAKLNFLRASGADIGFAKNLPLVKQPNLNHGSLAYAIGWIKYEQGDFASAIATFEKGLAIDPHNNELQNEYLATLMQLKRYTDVVAYADRLLTNEFDIDDETRAKFYRARGVALFGSGDLKASLDSLTVSQRYQPDDDAKRIEEQVKAALAAKPN